MTDSEKIELLKEYARFERYKKAPIANALISLLVKKDIISYAESKQLLNEFDRYMDSQVDAFFSSLKEDFNPDERED